MTSDAITPRRSALEDALVRQHLSLVTTAVNHIVGRLPRHVCRDDLVSAGMAALAQAARSYDETRETGFERHACARIRGALLDELRQRDWASRSVRTRARRLLGATEELTGRLGRLPTDAEVAGHLGLSVAGVAAVQCDVHRARVLSFDGLVCDDPEMVLPADEHSPELAVIDQERRAYMVDAVATLPVRLRQVVVGYFFEERTSQELADELGVSTSRISQLRTEALRLLRAAVQPHVGAEALAAIR